MLNSCLDEHIMLAEKMRNILPEIQNAANLSITALNNGKKILLCGNGGSAADAQHIAAELSGRFQRDRQALSAISLTTDTSALTAIANDYGFDYIFSRQVDALAVDGDILIAISTSGNSKNTINAIYNAKQKGCKIITLTGKDGGHMSSMGDTNIIIPSNVTARIQEMHIMSGHMICAIIDNNF